MEGVDLLLKLADKRKNMRLCSSSQSSGTMAVIKGERTNLKGAAKGFMALGILGLIPR